MKQCVFAGTFDPITIGHIDIIERACNLFDVVNVAIMDNIDKKPLFTLEKRMHLLEISLKKYDNVKLHYHNGLLVDFMKKENINVIVRGVRNSTDYDYERVQESINRNLFSGIEVVYLGSTIDKMHISSSVVRELLKHKKNIKDYVPFDIEEVN